MNRLLFSKTGFAKYISHLDLMRTMQRAILRAGMEIRHTQGFNPHPHMVFALPLPVGCESVCEILDFELVNQLPDSEIVSLLNKTMPEGITVISAYSSEKKLKEIAWVDMELRYVYDRDVTQEDADMLTEMLSQPEVVVVKKTKRGFSDINIREMIDKISVSVYNKNEIVISAVIAAQNPSLNPLLITEAVRKYEPTLAPDEAYYVRKEIYDSSMSIFR